MKRMILLALLFVACARAEWSDVKEGLGPQSVIKLVGTPLVGSSGHGGQFVTWIYDRGGYIVFENGRVAFWQAPAEPAAPKP